MVTHIAPGAEPPSTAPTQNRAGDAAGNAGPPPVRWLLTEPARSALGLARAGLAAPWLARAPRGDGHPVLILPGLLAGDASTTLLRGFLLNLGYQPERWGLGRNVGPTAEVVAGLPRALAKLARQAGGPVSVIGWSLGGIYARYLAHRNTELVRQIITLGSPFAMRDPRQSRASWTFERHAHEHAVHFDIRAAELSAPVPVPATSVYSRRDGIVDWRGCIDPPGPRRQNIEVRCSHLGFGHDAATLWVIADRLALPAGEWTPFTPPRLLRLLYPDQR
jgi:pimeloyl-ACP methyl ester carboxylesterase